VAVRPAVDAAAIARVVPVEEASQVGEARRAATLAADRAGLDETGRGRVALVATELASNLARHARGGALLLRLLAADEEGPGVELIAIDHGPGMDVARSLEDGYSTGGTAGEGLGAVRRTADTFDVHSRRDRGTIVLARVVERAANAETSPRVPVRTGVICTAAPGEERSGDGWAVQRRAGLVRLLVVDGLGHGPLAAEAANEAVRLFRAYPEPGPAEMLERLHEALRGTRGAAAAVAEIVPGDSAVRFAGIGNIAASVRAADGARSLVSHNGIIGHQVRKVQEVSSPWSSGALLVMASDGLRTQWRLDDDPTIVARHPAVVAALLYREFLRGRDDATVLVAHGAPSPGD
jgi:anti-sigma regulatory factor (Ser/Thr protein kinase)